MGAFLDFEEIQAFKGSRTALLNGVNYAHVVAPFLYDRSTLGFFRKLVFSLFFATRITVDESKENGLLLYYSCRHKGRADYDYIPERIRALLGTRCDYVESSERFSLIQFIHTLKKLPSSWRSTQGYPPKGLTRLGCALLIGKYRSTAERTFPSLLKRRHRLITFCDAQAPENLMAQMAHNFGIETFTNQHGQYRILDSSNISSDAEAYANFVSNYMLCWGEATREEFVRAGFKPEQFIITGWIKQWTNAMPHPPRGVFGVMLNGENGNESNIALLYAARSIAASLNYRYIVRLHPWSKPRQYSQLLDNRCTSIGHYGLLPYLEQVDFSLAHMTGATIEMLHTGALVYLLDDGKLAELFRVDGLNFKTADSIASTALTDMDASRLGRRKNKQLSKWFNDDEAQSAHILAALLDERF